MGKKNPYVTTIGFNKEDPEHRRAAELLNEMGRGKAAYITRAIMAYETLKEKGKFSHPGIGEDYENLRNFVLKIIAEHEKNGVPAFEQIIESKTEDNQKQEALTDQIGFDESAIQDILLSVEAFRG